MKVLKLAFAAALLAAPLAVAAQPAMNDHRVVRTERTVERPDGSARTVERTVVRHDDRRNWDRRDTRRDWRGDDRRYRQHNGWDRGRHYGWRERCGYRWKHGHRIHTCWRVRG